MISFFSTIKRAAKATLYACACVLLLSGQSAAQSQSEATKKLFDAVYNGKLDQVQITIAAGADINALNAWGITPVDLAVDKGHFDIVRFLLQVRDVQSQKMKSPPTPVPATVTSLRATPIEPTDAPAPAAAPVGEVYAPPASADPWSATVVTSEPPPPPPPVIAAGPSPFDQENTSEAALPIIGTVRGPAIDTGGQTALKQTFREGVKQTKKETKPEPVKKITEVKSPPGKVAPSGDEDSGIWGNIKNLLNFDETQKSEMPAPAKQVPEATKQPTPVMEVRKAASLALPTAPVSPPNVTGPPPIIDGTILPEGVTPAPLTNLSNDDMEQPRVVPMQPKAPPVQIKTQPVQAKTPSVQAKTPSVQTKTPPNTTIAKVTRIAKPENSAAKPPAQGASGQPAVQVGTTTLPGKPPEQGGFFSKVMAIFSSDDETKQTENERPAPDDQAPAQSGDWTVKNIEQAQVVPRTPVKKVVRKLPENRLNGVILSIGRTTALGKLPPPQAPAPWYYKSCINKKLGSTTFCIEEQDWPNDIRPYYLTDSILYEGTQSIVRYDEGAATYFHTLFPSQSYKSIVEYFSRRYGPPTQRLKRSIAPLAEARKINPTVIWQSIAPVTNLLTSLEIRMFDDNRGGFPDTRRGAVYLYHEWSQPVFPQLSSVELMLLRAEAKQR